MRIAYFDCFAGISGDMALAALLDAGADAATLVAGLKTIPLPAWELHLTPVRKCGFAALAVTVTVGGEPAGMHTQRIVIPPPTTTGLASPISSPRFAPASCPIR